MNSDYLFVYGTLRQHSQSEMYHLLADNADFVGHAVYQGKLYLVDYYPGVIPSDNPQDTVYGEVYKLQSADRVLPELDIYEECSSEFPKPTEYSRCQKNVKLASGEIIKVWIYIYNHPIDHLELIVSGDFYKR